MSILSFGATGTSLDLTCPAIMGVLNVTPDSFSDGGRFTERDAAMVQVHAMIEAGAAIIDVGGESTRPGADAVSEAEEIRRVVPVIETIRAESDIPISIDTSKPGVMRAAVEAGAVMINDVRALREEGALQTAVELGLPVCLMHMQGEPRRMQHAPHYTDVVTEVREFLQERIAACQAAGLTAENLIIDPGFGFGKTLEHNLRLFRHLDTFTELGAPLLVGVSRKTMIGAVLDVPVAERQYGSVALAGLATWLGAAIIRVHDVRASVDAIRMIHAVKSQ